MSELPGCGTALRFDAHVYATFDCYMLERPGAEADHPEVRLIAPGIGWPARRKLTRAACLRPSWRACRARSIATIFRACASAGSLWRH